MHDLQTIRAMNKAAEERYYAQKRKEEKQAEFDALAHSIANDATFDVIDPVKTIRYEAIREYLKELEAK